MKKRVMLILSCLFLSIGFIVAQTTRISGTVVDGNNEPVISASVVVKGTTIGTVTDVDGKFSINVPSGNKVLVFTLVGMKTTEMKPSQDMRVVMENDETLLDEVMVVAFTTAKKSAFTGSAAVVNASDISKRVTTNVTNALTGAVPGLQLRGGSGAPGADNGSINIRGIASMYAATDPLIIVDGAPYPLNLSNIPQSDIESITVLKDAASAALYGARGAAGVIIITTKKGQPNKTVITVDAKWGANTRSVKEYDVITDPGEYYEAYYKQMYNYYYYGQGYNLAAANAKANSSMLDDLKYNVYTVPNGQLLIGTDGRLNPNATLGRKYEYNGEQYYMQPDDWTDMAYKTALRQEYTLSVNGGTDRSSFYASIGYLDEDGIIEYSSYKRISARIKADYQATKWLKVGANAGYVNSDQKSNPNMDTSSGSTNLMYYTSLMAPIYPIYVRGVDANGNVVIKTDEYGNPAYDYGVAASNYGVQRPFGQTGNPLGSNRYNEVTRGRNQLTGTFNADANITSFLKASVTSTVIWEQTNYSDYQNPFYGPKVNINGEITKSSTTGLRTNNIQTLTYLQDFGQHSVTLMLGHEYYRVENKYLAAIAQGGYSPDIKEINAFANPTSSNSYTTRYNNEGYFGNALYNYMEKYFASASYRREATSRFKKENRWGDFWSVGGAWIISKEDFMQDFKWIDMLKIKASIGQQGNDNIPDYAYIDLYSLSKTSSTTMSPSFARMGNPNITWETTTNFNTGIEFGFLKNRIMGNFDFYNKKTTDLLFWISVPESAGTRGFYDNLGDIRNTGVELTLTGAIVRTKDIDWSVTANISHNSTKILKLPDSKTRANGGFLESNTPRTFQNWYEVGGSLYSPCMPVYAGVNDEGLPTYWVDANLKGDTDRPGKEYSYTTTSANDASKYVLDSSLPKVFGGFSTTLRIKDFDASATFDYQIGGKVLDSRYLSLMAPSSGGSNFHKDYAKSWNPNNTSSNIPRWQYNDQYINAVSDRFMTSASYINFQSFTVGYTLPKKLLNKVEIANLRVYVAGENLGFISARKGLDPRYSYDGNESVAVYSPIRNISGGIQVTF